MTISHHPGQPGGINSNKEEKEKHYNNKPIYIYIYFEATSDVHQGYPRK